MAGGDAAIEAALTRAADLADAACPA